MDPLPQPAIAAYDRPRCLARCVGARNPESRRLPRDVAAAIPFYREVFGWQVNTFGEGDMAYTFWALGDRTIATMMPMPEAVPAEVPAHWGIYFVRGRSRFRRKAHLHLGAGAHQR